MRQLKFHCHQHVNDIGYLSLFQAASTPKASPRQMKRVAVVIQEQPPKDFLLYSRSSKLAVFSSTLICFFTFEPMLSSVFRILFCVGLHHPGLQIKRALLSIAGTLPNTPAQPPKQLPSGL